ncbi:MAG: type II secretion system minor pseudopilin GspJ [Sphingopyxis sp.]|uniref:type II secretion system minor pseudopilin GspJ n=1 Tax=Sphingopyxis sp. TaxID=1908224 RepID=UPI002AB8635B|nr:type II secretion system minor pseudopilin GspJ [Sphingopyxis sp.]MDZ3832779.1 type II secretion system minor pseudopilin GspJ [Sphingopyxis sp.]
MTGRRSIFSRFVLRAPKGGEAQCGFTLVEMLVALSLFAAIAAIGVGLLRASVDTQDAVQQRLKAMGGVNRLRAVMANDLAQAVPRPTRGQAGEALPAFAGSASGFAFVHAGAGAAAGGPRPAVERVGYALAGGEWRRAVQPMLDGTALGEGDAIARQVTAAQLRYRDAEGNWGDSWTSDPGDRLPRAVELRLTREGRAPLVLFFLVAPAPVPPPAAGAAP